MTESYYGLNAESAKKGTKREGASKMAVFFLPSLEEPSAGSLRRGSGRALDLRGRARLLRLRSGQASMFGARFRNRPRSGNFAPAPVTMACTPMPVRS